MPRYSCLCGAKYKFPDSAVGKKAKCKKCGEVFTLPAEDDAPIAMAEDSTFGVAPAAPPAPAAVAEQPAKPHPAMDPNYKVEILPPEPAERPKSALFAYVRDVVRSFLLFGHIKNVFIFLLLWPLILVASVILPNAGIWGFGGSLIVTGWYCGYLFNVIEGAVAGEKQLADFTVDEGIFYGCILPVCKYFGSWLILLAPALLYLSVMMATRNVDLSPLEDGVWGLAELAEDKAMIPFIVLLLLAFFSWPIVILCVAVGGFGTLGRLDLMIATVLKTLPVYLFMVLLVFANEFMPEDPIGTSIGSAAIAVGVAVYFDLVSMRVIGLYYHHFKDRFAWSWG